MVLPEEPPHCDGAADAPVEAPPTLPLLQGDAVEPIADTEAPEASAQVVFLTVNDVYELFPDPFSGRGGLAELSTLLKETKARLPSGATVIVTLNGDFLWQSELDRQDKGPLMVEVLNCLGVELVVLGNHEFDFGAPFLSELLRLARFKCLGSNVRSSATGELFSGLEEDTLVLPLSNGLHLGLFGLCTTVTGRDPFAGDSVRFEDEIAHAQRCVSALKAQQVDAIVALTHVKVDVDQRIARHVPGIDLILGGHDHEPFSLFVGSTFIHKSGMDALWLGVINMQLHRPPPRFRNLDKPVEVEFNWSMLVNRGFDPDPDCLALLQRYVASVEEEERAAGKLEPLAISLTALDGTRATCRTRESNLGNLVADALRHELQADVGLVNAGFIKGDVLNADGLAITWKWLERYLPLVKLTVVVQMTALELKTALAYWLRRYPSMSSSFPHVSGVQLEYDMATSAQPFIRSFRLSLGTDELADDHVLTVAVPQVASLDGWRFFAAAKALRTGPIVRNAVAAFVSQRGQLMYPPREDRVVIIE